MRKDTNSSHFHHQGPNSKKHNFNFYMVTQASIELAINRTPFYQKDKVIFYKEGDQKSVKVHIISIPIGNNNVYILQIMGISFKHWQK